MSEAQVAGPSAVAFAARRRAPGRRERLSLARRYVIAIVLSIVFLFPVYWMFSVSLKTPEEIFNFPRVWYPHDPQFGSFEILFKDGDVIAVWNSLITASISTAISMFLGTICAYSIVRFNTGGQNLAIWILSQRMLPPHRHRLSGVLRGISMGARVGPSRDVAVSGIRITRSSAASGLCVPALVRHLPCGLIILYIAFNLPYVIWMMRGYIEDVPVELEESALVDGCTRWQVLVKVVLPMVRSGLFATAVFAFIFAWNEFIFALVLTRNEVITFPVQVTHFMQSQATIWGKISAMAVLGTLPVFFAVATLQRYLVRGISMGAIKG